MGDRWERHVAFGGPTSQELAGAPPFLESHRMIKHLFRSSGLALALLAATVQPVSANSPTPLAPTVNGSVQFDLSRPEYLGGKINLFSALPSNSLSFTHVRATFTAQVMGDGQVLRTFYAEIFKTEQYQTHSFTRWVYSPITTLNITLNLGADELATLSKTGNMEFSFGSSIFTMAPSLLLEYSAVSAVPEARTAALLALGLAAIFVLRVARR